MWARTTHTHAHRRRKRIRFPMWILHFFAVAVVFCHFIFGVFRVHCYLMLFKGFYGASIWFRIRAERAVRIPQFNEYGRFSCAHHRTTSAISFFLTFFLHSFILFDSLFVLPRAHECACVRSVPDLFPHRFVFHLPFTSFRSGAITIMRSNIQCDESFSLYLMCWCSVAIARLTRKMPICTECRTK